MHIYTQDPPGNVSGHGPVRPSGLTDPLALFRYLKVVLISWEVCCRNIVFFLILYYEYCIVLFTISLLIKRFKTSCLELFNIRPSFIWPILSQKLELATEPVSTGDKNNVIVSVHFHLNLHISSTNTCKHSGSLCISCMALEQIPSEEGMIMNPEMEAWCFELAATLAWSWKAVA